jgi:hypothetical protein
VTERVKLILIAARLGVALLAVILFLTKPGGDPPVPSHPPPTTIISAQVAIVDDEPPTIERNFKVKHRYDPTPIIYSRRTRAYYGYHNGTLYVWEPARGMWNPK